MCGGLKDTGRLMQAITVGSDLVSPALLGQGKLYSSLGSALLKPLCTNREAKPINPTRRETIL